MQQLISDSKQIIIQNNAIPTIEHWMNFGVEIDNNDSELKNLELEDWEAIFILYNLVNKNETEQQTIWYRGFSAKDTKFIDKNGFINSTMITSITLLESVAECFGEKWKVIVEPETPCLYISVLSEIDPIYISVIDAEREGLLGRGQFLKIAERTLLFEPV